MNDLKMESVPSSFRTPMTLEALTGVADDDQTELISVGLHFVS